MHFEILDTKRINFLENISQKIDLSDFYLAGGTGLSLQLKLRKSFDFDFFSPKSFNENILYQSFQSLYPEKIKVLTLNQGTCDLFADGIHISFFQYPYPLIENLFRCGSPFNLNLAGVKDIAAMKMSAIGGRGAKKDFFDLYQIFTRTNLSSQQLIECLQMKYGRNFDFSYMVMGLDYFDDADQEILPELFVEYDWNKAKDFFVQKKKELMQYGFAESGGMF